MVIKAPTFNGPAPTLTEYREYLVDRDAKGLPPTAYDIEMTKRLRALLEAVEANPEKDMHTIVAEVFPRRQ